MADLRGFNAHEVEPSMEFEAIPAGRYPAVIVGSEMKRTKSGSGSFLELTFEIIEGEHKGRKLWSRLNLDNPNLLTVEIAKAELSAICRAVDVMQPDDSEQLHNIPLVITVKCKVRDDGEVVNEVKGYAKREVLTPDPRQTTSETPPWMRN